jgi:hypothetical protein
MGLGWFELIGLWQSADHYRQTYARAHPPTVRTQRYEHDPDTPPACSTAATTPARFSVVPRFAERARPSAVLPRVDARGCHVPVRCEAQALRRLPVLSLCHHASLDLGEISCQLLHITTVVFCVFYNHLSPHVFYCCLPSIRIPQTYVQYFVYYIRCPCGV